MRNQLLTYDLSSQCAATEQIQFETLHRFSLPIEETVGRYSNMISMLINRQDNYKEGQRNHVDSTLHNLERKMCQNFYRAVQNKERTGRGDLHAMGIL